VWFVYSDMSDVDTIGAQVSHDSQLHERFEDYEEEMGFESRSEAVRSLLRTGLDAYQEEQEQHREEARTSTATEEWCRIVSNLVLRYVVVGLGDTCTLVVVRSSRVVPGG